MEAEAVKDKSFSSGATSDESSSVPVNSCHSRTVDMGLKTVDREDSCFRIWVLSLPVINTNASHTIADKYNAVLISSSGKKWANTGNSAKSLITECFCARRGNAITANIEENLTEMNIAFISDKHGGLPWRSIIIKAEAGDRPFFTGNRVIHWTRND